MKSALILAKNADFFSDLVASLVANGLTDGSSHNSAKILPKGARYDENVYILIFDRTGEMAKVIEMDIPSEVIAQGYRYSFLAECRSEEFFVEILGDPALNLDMLIWDNEGVIFKPSELDAANLSL